MKVTAHELRAAAEHADGLRGQPGLKLAYRDKPRGLEDRRRGVRSGLSDSCERSQSSLK